MSNLVSKKRRNSGRATLADVAKLAGVGTMTVSRALRTPNLVSDKLKQKIHDAINQLGYLPNLAASNLASASSSLIAMLAPSLTEFGCAEIFSGLQQILQPAGYHILLAETQYQSQQEEQLLENFLIYNPVAIILLGMEHTSNTLEWLNRLNIPVLELGAQRAKPIDLNIGFDYTAAIYQITQSVIAKGYKNIGLLCAAQEGMMFQQYLAGWHKALLQHYLSPHRVINAAESPSFLVGSRLLPEFTLNWPEIDALICTADELACGALYECQRRYIRVPNQLAIVGLGNLNISQVCQPPLTTVEIPYRKLGIQAGETLFQQLSGANEYTISAIPAIDRLIKLRGST